MSAEGQIKLWEDHVAGEFLVKDVELSLSTMVEDASVVHIPTGSGGTGKEELRVYYRDIFIPSIPDAWEHVMTNRVVTEGCIVEEADVHLTHSKQMDWFLPSVPATGKQITAQLVIVVEFRAGKMSAERIYWDHAAVLRQIGKI